MVFASDNGYFYGEHKLGDKRRAYEEGLRIPLLMRYPRLIPSGSRPNQMVLNIDLAPTFLALAGAPAPSSMQGQTLTSLFSKKAPRWRSSFVTEYFLDPGYPQTPRWQSIRTEQWKYIHHQDFADADELYDLQKDPYELKNLVNEPSAAAILQRMKKDLVRG